ncbi:hypothetical protein ICN46_06975 [Polynucleobacter sp. Latsch14-2]|jgi:hypothetical protein|uniref:hypothetical protein n=1 Tax=Polynucleobacter sp. Latsch14-2 TaxID=2576920 RepID=UPI001C0DED34|nr:hypothetical protein [Polynucleobacter sp. Latsch14-2]MBU3614634.1 hypothetical protein [Polynucleobacter sp. Latsch14-2]
MKRVLISIGLLFSCLGNLYAAEEVSSWSCQDNRQFKTSGTAEKIQLVWESKTYEMKRENSLPGSLRYKNQSTGHDLVVLQNKAMLFNIRTGTRLADFCQTAEMKTGKIPHLFAEAEPFVQQ